MYADLNRKLSHPTPHFPLYYGHRYILCLLAALPLHLTCLKNKNHKENQNKNPNNTPKPNKPHTHAHKKQTKPQPNEKKKTTTKKEKKTPPPTTQSSGIRKLKPHRGCTLHTTLLTKWPFDIKIWVIALSTHS